MATFPTPDEPTPPSPPVPPDRTPSGRSAKPTDVRAVLWAGLLVLIGIIALLIVLSA